MDADIASGLLLELPSDSTSPPSILDRLLHHATVLSINGDSYRMRAHRDAIAAR